MIAVDANILLRSIVRDIPEQAYAADAFLAGLTPESPGFICREVALETAWVLERVYDFARTEVTNAMLRVALMGNVIMEDRGDVVNAALAYGRGGPDFADLMILAAAKRVGAAPLYTFDRRLAREEGAALLGVQPA